MDNRGNSRSIIQVDNKIGRAEKINLQAVERSYCRMNRFLFNKIIGRGIGYYFPTPLTALRRGLLPSKINDFPISGYVTD